ncbi:MAG: DUF1257 domain-containing protein [Planctomycetes bacterium]|nr:DUF1257 domain-containing protein [Planctomycetota bacterium]
MSCVLVVTPLVIGSWPAISAAVTAAIATMGYSLAKAAGQRHGVDQHGKAKAEITVEDSEILEDGAGTGQEIVVEKDGIRATFSRDARGALRVCMEGEGHSKAELKKIGEELIGRVTQQYVYHKVVTELKERRMAIVGEEVGEDRTIKIHVRNW